MEIFKFYKDYKILYKHGITIVLAVIVLGIQKKLVKKLSSVI